MVVKLSYTGLLEAFVIFKSLGSFSLILAALGSPAAAQPPVENAQTSKQPSTERICENIIVTGSRLGTKKICATRAEWAERRLQDRQVVEQIQTRLNGPCSTVQQHSGTPTC
jgi:hypothetical protein